ncbi:MAG: tetratricopeptide repeat protein [Gammaproteobacteria bacterium]
MNVKLLCCTVLAAGLLGALPGVVHASAFDDAQVLIQQGKLEAALKKLDTHLRRNRQDAQARFTRGVVLAELGRVEEGVSAFATLVRDYPEMPEPYNNLAVLYARQGRFEDARAALEAAAVLQPDAPATQENLGDVYAAQARAAYARALALDPDNAALQRKWQQLSGEAAPVTVVPPLPATPPEVEAEAAPAPAPAPPAAPAERDALIAAVQNWAEAWSAQDLARYIGAYAPDYAPPEQSRAEWVAQREERILGAQDLRVSVVDPQVDAQGDSARVRFVQRYVSRQFSDEVVKWLDFRRQDGVWYIVGEITR